MKKLGILFLIVIILVSCQTEPYREITATSISLNKNELIIETGDNFLLSVTFTPENVSNKSLTWVSSNKRIATVDDGIVVGVAPGKTEIIVKNGNVVDKCSVTVLLSASGLSLNTKEMTLVKGESATLTATVEPSGSTDIVKWQSSNTSIVTVDNGRITAIKPGEAIISATAGTKMAQCAVLVINPATNVSLDKTELEIHLDETIQLVAYVVPEDATDEILWSSSNPNVVSVENGMVTGVAPGFATITATAGKEDCKCEVSVLPYKKGIVDLGLVMTREDGTTYNLYWADCNLGANSPEESGNYYAWGETDIKDNYSWSSYKWANGDSNKLTKYCQKVYVSHWGGLWAPDDKEILDAEDDVAFLTLGEDWRIPSDLEWTELREKCSWIWVKQGDTEGYRVTGPNGKSIFLPAVGSMEGSYCRDKGTKGYYLSSTLESRSNTCNPARSYMVCFSNSTIEIINGGRSYGRSIRPVYSEQVHVNEIVLDRSKDNMYLEEILHYNYVINPSYAFVKSVSWKSSNPNVATVENGYLFAHNPGTTIITVTSNDRNFSSSCTLNVSNTHISEGVTDLGISLTHANGKQYTLYWSKCNMGANKPEGYGDYYAWGEVETKETYDWNTYKWSNGAEEKLTKYCPTNRANYWDGEGSPDGKLELDPEDDAARVVLGGQWRMPTGEELQALRNQCEWELEVINGTIGYTVKSKSKGNLNSIFLPFAGCLDWNSDWQPYFEGIGAYFWSSTLSISTPIWYPQYAYGMYINSYGPTGSSDRRARGFPVRAVRE